VERLRPGGAGASPRSAPPPGPANRKGTPLDQNTTLPGWRKQWNGLLTRARPTCAPEPRWPRANASGQPARQMVKRPWPHSTVPLIPCNYPRCGVHIPGPRSFADHRERACFEAPGSGRPFGKRRRAGARQSNSGERLPHDPVPRGRLARLTRSAPLRQPSSPCWFRSALADFAIWLSPLTAGGGLAAVWSAKNRSSNPPLQQVG